MGRGGMGGGMGRMGRRMFLKNGEEGLKETSN